MLDLSYQIPSSRHNQGPVIDDSILNQRLGVLEFYLKRLGFDRYEEVNPLAGLEQAALKREGIIGLFSPDLVIPTILEYGRDDGLSPFYVEVYPMQKFENTLDVREAIERFQKDVGVRNNEFDLGYRLLH